jgi:thiol-disulfide isomerase/thioredoxin
MKLLIFAFALCSFIGLAGCDSHKPAPSADKSPRQEKETPAPGPKAEEKAVELKAVKLGEFTKVIEGHKGKVVVVDFWATWCPPCMREFPNLVKLHQKHRGKDVVCISVSFDDLEKKESALKFLKKVDADFANFIPDGDDQAWKDHWSIGPLPAVVVYDATGKRHTTFESGDPERKTPFNYENDVDPLVQKLIKK